MGQAMDTLKRHAADYRQRRRTRMSIAADNPRFVDALRADVPIELAQRGEAAPESKVDFALQTIRLAATSDSFLALVLYRGRAAMLRRGVPVLPVISHRLSMAVAQVCIGDPVVIQPGLRLPHGQVVIDGITRIGSGVTIMPWTTVGLKAGDWNGPTIGDNATLGTGAKVLGSVSVGKGARVGANAVVVSDVSTGATVVGVPAVER